ncbi:hypothetical protein QQS21_008300 [Conoideocrella luteorostrata]|uniref:AN1-type domain-containing protein n=1 Tax=Conoideocrella luteorostrata TaxID=1105319 RepID=A0AAJ0CLG3_9HYPO|nr:hypothetical protein QQS21_008300 [Conoideocrella luteorostrata]
MAPKKLKCSAKECREQLSPFPVLCSFCHGRFCNKHRMLEDHQCPELEDCKKQEHERNAAKLEAERTPVIRGV